MPFVIDGATVIETPTHPLIARLYVLPDTVPGARRPKVNGDYLSPSQIKKYVRCQAQYMFQYMYKLREPQNSSSFFGQSVHNGAEAYLRLKRQNPTESHEFMKEQAVDQAALFIRTDMPKNIVWKKQWPNGKDEDFDSLLENSKKAVELMADKVWVNLDPIEIEKGYLIEWQDSTILPLLGYADAIVRTSLGPEIIDFKTGREKKEMDVKLDIALSAYAQAYQIQSGEVVSHVSYKSLVRNKEPKIVSVEGQRIPQDLSRVRNIAKVMTKALQEGIYIPVDDATICGTCTFYDRCREEFA